jgi:hypothetical protein
LHKILHIGASWFHATSKIPAELFAQTSQQLVPGCGLASLTTHHQGLQTILDIRGQAGFSLQLRATQMNGYGVNSKNKIPIERNVNTIQANFLTDPEMLGIAQP